MKKLFFLSAVFAISITASAQTTRIIKGAVIDKDGNPLIGAIVSSPNGSEITTVDADGTFSLEVPIWLKCAIARYEGLKDKKLNIKDTDMIFRMRPERESQWFIIGNYAYFIGEDSSHMGGLIGGCLGKWGWYGKINVGDGFPVTWNVTAGVTKRIIAPLHAHIGFGMGFVPGDRDKSVLGLGPEIGLICKIGKHFLINVAYQPMYNTEDCGMGHGCNIGFGYAF